MTDRQTDRLNFMFKSLTFANAFCPEQNSSSRVLDFSDLLAPSWSIADIVISECFAGNR